MVDQQLISSQRSGRTTVDVTYALTLENTGAPAAGVAITVQSSSPYTVVLDADVSVGDVPLGVLTANDTFTVRHNRRVRFNPAVLSFSIVSAPPPVENLPPQILSVAPIVGQVGESYRYDVDAIDPNAGDVLTYTLPLAPSGMSIDPATGAIRWTPELAGAFDVDLLVTDEGGLSARQLVLIEVAGAADDAPPTLAPIADQTVLAGETLVVQAQAQDPADELLRFTLTGPDGMTVGSAGSLRWAPTLAQVGTSPVTVTVSDPGGQRASTDFRVTVLAEAPNQPPALAPLADVTVTAGETVSLTLAGSDPDVGDQLTYGGTGLPGAQLDPRSGALNWATADADAGTTSVTAEVRDLAGAAASQSFRVTVRGAPKAPVAVDDRYALAPTTQLSIDSPGVLANDSDANGDGLSVSNTSEPAVGTLDSFPGDGSLVYTPPPRPPINIGLQLLCESDVGFQTSAVAVADVDLDGVVELVGVVNSGLGTRLRVLDGETCATERDIFLDPDVGQLSWISSVLLVNLDDDPELELVAPYFRFSPFLTILSDGFHFTALNLDGTPVWSTPGGLSEAQPFALSNNLNQIKKSPTAVDLNGDGQAELLWSLGNVGFAGNTVRGAVLAYDGRTGELLWTYLGPPMGGVFAPKSPAIADLDLDGEIEIIWHTSVLRPDGTLKFTLPTELYLAGNTGSAFLSVAVANLDNDPYAEIIGIDTRNHYVYEHTGEVKWQRPRPRNGTGAFSQSDIVVAQLDDGPGTRVRHHGAPAGDRRGSALCLRYRWHPAVGAAQPRPGHGARFPVSRWPSIWTATASMN